MIQIANRMKAGRISTFSNLNVSKTFTNQKITYPGSSANNIIKSFRINTSLLKYNFSSQKNNENELKGRGRKLYRNQKDSSKSKYSIQLLNDIETFLLNNSNLSKVKILDECQNSTGFIDRHEMFQKIMALRNFILEVKYSQIKKTSDQELLQVFEILKQNYGLAVERKQNNRLMKEMDFQNTHCQVAILAYFSKLFLMIPLLQRVSASTQREIFEKSWLQMYEYLAFAFDSNFNTISMLKADSMFQNPQERFRFVVKKEIRNQFEQIQSQLLNSKFIQKYHVNQESAMIQAAILSVIRNYGSPKTFHKLSVKKLDQILETKLMKDSSAKEEVMLKNGKRSIEYLKQLIESNKIQKINQRASNAMANNISDIAMLSYFHNELTFMGNGPLTAVGGQFFDVGHSPIEGGQSDAGGLDIDF